MSKTELEFLYDLLMIVGMVNDHLNNRDEIHEALVQLRARILLLTLQD